MTSITSNLSLTLYDASTDQTVTFATFRAVWGGPASTSNFYRIDTAYGVQAAQITSLQNTRGAIPVPALYASANYYTSTGITAITAYTPGMTIIVYVDTTTDGTVTLDINSLGTKSLMKVNSTGAAINLTGSDLVKGRYYLFAYDGTRWLWVSANSADQIQIVGTVGNLMKIGSTNNLEDSGLSSTTIVSIADVQTVTNKRITDRTGTVTSHATPTINTDNVDYFSITAQAEAITSMTTNLSGTPTENQELMLSITGTAARAITWGTSFENGTATLPTTTVGTNRLDVYLVWNSVTSKWRCMLGAGGGDLVSPLVSAEISITGTDTATIGRMHVISGSSNYTVTLPATSGNTGKFVGIRVTNTGTTTLDGNGAETIDGVATRAFYQGQSVFVLCDGSNWFSVSQKIAPRSAELSTINLVGSGETTFTFNVAQVFSHWVIPGTYANGFTGSFGLFLNAGTYTCKVLGVTNPALGKLDWTLDGVSQTTGQDWYSAATTYNVFKTFTLTVVNSGYHRLMLTVNGKHASSSDYGWILTRVFIYPTDY